MPRGRSDPTLNITPESETTTHYFFAYSRTFARDDQSVTDVMSDVFCQVLQQDIDALEALEKSLGASTPAEMSAMSDANALKARQILERLMEEEQLAAPMSR